MTLLQIIIALVPVGIFYWMFNWQSAFYRHRSPQIRYRSLKDPLRRSTYLHMVLVAVASILVALPFILYTLFA